MSALCEITVPCPPHVSKQSYNPIKYLSSISYSHCSWQGLLHCPLPFLVRVSVKAEHFVQCTQKLTRDFSTTRTRVECISQPISLIYVEYFKGQRSAYSLSVVTPRHSAFCWQECVYLLQTAVNKTYWSFPKQHNWLVFTIVTVRCSCGTNWSLIRNLDECQCSDY